MTTAYLNRIATMVPDNDVHGCFVRYARGRFPDNRRQSAFQRMAERAQIDHRWSFLAPAERPEGRSVDAEGFYTRGRFPTTAQRMARYEGSAATLAVRAVAGLGLGPRAGAITHIIVVSCTGLFAPGVDLEVIRRCGLSPSVERTTVGFMGCQAALNALKLARHIVRSEPEAQVLLVSVELCTLHLQETEDLEQMLAFLIFGDGCAAALVSAAPEGLALERFHAIVENGTGELITWNIRDQGFDMHLSGLVPKAVGRALRERAGDILDGTPVGGIAHWAVHPGGRSILDSVQSALGLAAASLAPSRGVLRQFGNMSSATILFVLKAIMETAGRGESGCAMSFGPGLSAESLLFRTAGR
jgi:predicted naringenin-chalcone synthase